MKRRGEVGVVDEGRSDGIPCNDPSTLRLPGWTTDEVYPESSHLRPVSGHRRQSERRDSEFRFDRLLDRRDIGGCNES